LQDGFLTVRHPDHRSSVFCQSPMLLHLCSLVAPLTMGDTFLRSAIK